MTVILILIVGVEGLLPPHIHRRTRQVACLQQVHQGFPVDDTATRHIHPKRFQALESACRGLGVLGGVQPHSPQTLSGV